MEVSRFLLVFIMLMLISMICHSQDTDENLAFGKAVSQSRTYAQYVAGRAVNGVLDADDFSHVQSSEGSKWWRVDMGQLYNIGRIELYNRPGFYERLTNITIMTSTKANPPYPHNSAWTRRSSHQPAYGSVEISTYNPKIEARHVAVISYAINQPLTLVEVEIYTSRSDYAQAEFASTNQSSTYTDRISSAAVDGSLSTFSATRFAQNGWWKIKLGDSILFSYAAVYVNNGTGCSRSPICSDRLNNVYFVTNRGHGDHIPNIDSEGGWSVCNSSVAALGDDFTIRCDSNSSYLTPLTSQLVIMSFGGDGVALREVQVFGYALPELGDLAGRADNEDYTSVTVSFAQWDRRMPGGAPPTRYKVTTSASVQTFPHSNDNNSGRVSGVSFTELTPGQTYRITISCEIQAKACTGSLYSFLIEVRSCTAPTQPRNIVLTPETEPVVNNGRRRWKYTANWEPPMDLNCNNVSYKYGIYGSLTSQYTSETSTIFYLDGHQSYTFIILARNSNGSSMIVSSGAQRSAQIAPQSGPTNVALVAESVNAVRLSWGPPLHSGGPIIEYKYTCNDMPWATLNASLRTTVINGFSAYTSVTCMIKVRNAAGDSQVRIRTSKTACAVPSAPLNLQFTSIQTNHSSRRRWRYNAAWEQPLLPNCLGPLSYQIDVYGPPATRMTSNRYTMFYVDGNQFFNVTVKAKNSIGFSRPIVKSRISDKLAPQFGLGNVILLAVSSTAVRLSWDHPQYPGGQITRYQYSCNERVSWNEVPAAQRTEEISGFSAYTNVTCMIKATNAAGNSQEVARTVRTPCGAPLFRSGIVYSEDYNSNTESRTITVNLSQDIAAKCESLQPLEYRLDGGQFRANRVFRRLSALTNYSVSIKATNNAGNSTTRDLIIGTGELKPFDGPKIVSSGSANLSCVTATWREPLLPRGVITEYEFRCGRFGFSFGSWTSTGVLKYLVHCGYAAGHVVKCEIRAHTNIGAGPANTTNITVTCINPSTPKFNVSSFSENVMQIERVTVLLNLEPTQHNCQSLKHFTIKIINKADGAAANYTRPHTEVLNFTNFDAYTEYEISVTAENNQGLSSMSLEGYKTIEIAPQSKPEGFSLATNVSCVTLTASQPSKSNGKIIAYEFACQDKSSSKINTVNVSSENVAAFTSICGFQPASYVECTVVARNSAGTSPAQSKSEYITLKVFEKAKLSLEPPTSDYIPVVKIYPSKLDLPQGATISSYNVIVGRDVNKEPSSYQPISSTCRGWEQIWTRIDNEICYTAARLDVSLISSEGYSFNVGDGMVYGGYYNAPLQYEQVHVLDIAVLIELENGEAFNQLLDVALQLKALPSSCESPPSIDGAQVSPSAQSRLGDSVQYACSSGRLNSGGDLELTCQLNNEYESEWVGEQLKCSKIGTWIGVAIGSCIIATGIVVIVVCMVKRMRGRENMPNNISQPNPDDEYDEVVSGGQSENANEGRKVAICLTIQGNKDQILSKVDVDSEQCTTLGNDGASGNYEEIGNRPLSMDHIYSKIPGEGSAGLEYEALNTEKSPDHVYSAVN